MAQLAERLSEETKFAVLKDLFGQDHAEQSKAVAQKADAVPPHGLAALLNSAGVRFDMHSSVSSPTNFAEVLPLLPSEYENDMYEVFTGVTAASGTNPDTWCEDPPQPGYLKTCQVLTPFGDIWGRTKTIEIPEHISRADRADVNRRLLNWHSGDSNPFLPQIPAGINPNRVLDKEFMEFGYHMSLATSHVNIQGSRLNTGALGYLMVKSEWNGLDSWIHDAYADYPTSADCAGLDSLVTNYGNGDLDADFYTHLSNVLRTLREDASSMGFGRDTVWMLVAHPMMKYNLIDTVSCNFASTRCSTTGVQDGRAAEIQSLNIDMQNNEYIPVDNFKYPIMFDWGVPATYNAATNVWTSDIYIVPMVSGRSGEFLTFMEYMPFNNPMAAGLGLNVGDFMLMNGGMYLTRRATGDNMCIDFRFSAKMRMIMRTTFLAARIDDINWTGQTQQRSPYHGDTYYRNGGQYVRQYTTR